jgi:2,3-bisphosphoglycerate-independent phosphoglycerate mutase
VITFFMSRPKPVVLTILDGFGCGSRDAHDAVHLAYTPCLDMLFANYPHTTVNASELHVGLPHGQMGNSEVGHMNIGAGRVVMQDLPRIDLAIADGSIHTISELERFIAKVKQGTNTCHLLGLVSDGGVHSHQAHIVAMVKILASAGLKVVIHAFLDGRDTPPKSALEYIVALQKEIAGLATIGTIGGRYFAMDRDARFERVKQAYDAMVGGVCARVSDAKTAIENVYAQGVTDEFVPPCLVGDFDGMKDGDALMMCNFRADRARQILTALLDKNFTGFDRMRVVNFSATLGMVEYSSALVPLIPALFTAESLSGLLGEVVANAGLTQLRIAETEKYAHVTFFFNGGREDVYAGEERILIPSPNVATYDLKPEMSAFELTDALVDAIENDRFDFIVVNYANTDMVGHTGDVQAAKAAVEAVDKCLKRVSDAVLAKGGAMLITADHGNAEQMYDDVTKQAHTAHTLNLVPALMVSNALAGKKCDTRVGKLADIAPTILEFLQLPKPPQMTGNSLLKGIYA